MSEKEIIDLLKNHNEEGLQEFISHYGPLIRYIISPIITTHQDREDCFNEVIIRIWEKIHLFDESRGSFKAYITSIARNNALNRVRGSRYDIFEPLTDLIPSPQSSPEDMLLKKEAREKLLAALDTLSHKDKTLFYRKYYYLQSTLQIASETKLSPRAVEGRLYRIRKRLQKILGGEFYE